MKHSKIIEISGYRKKIDKKKEGDRLNDGKKGRVYSRGGKLWVDFYYLGERVREPSGLEDTPPSRIIIRKQLDLVMAEIVNGVFEFAKRFPNSKRKDYFSMLEGRILRKEPEDILFKDYVDRWWEEMEPGMSESQIRDYTTILKTHHMPYFSKMRFSEICSKLRMKKYVAHLKGKKTPLGKPLSAKRIRNVMIPLRVIVRDAMEEYEWRDLIDPFSGLKLPKVRKKRIHPFTVEEWAVLKGHLPVWLQPYFEFAVQTGLRPSEQVALKWAAVDAGFIYIELSRVRNREKTDLKTPESNRRIEIRPSMRKILEVQRRQTVHFQSEYVFVNTKGLPCVQDTLRGHWVKAMEKSGLPFRRMYETRHTFASWALSKGEAPEWVARILGHVSTAMVFNTYSRYIPNMTRRDGSVLEEMFSGDINKKGSPE
ncbi:MAG: site-specific integrase [Deltaproteobacteria bacterium]|nr:site-specific integrase [Deltaproteobacteria bacterium]